MCLPVAGRVWLGNLQRSLPIQTVLWFRGVSAQHFWKWAINYSHVQCFFRNYSNASKKKLQWYVHVCVWFFSPFQCWRNQSLLQNGCYLRLSFLLFSCKNSYHNIGYFQYHQFPICEAAFFLVFAPESVEHVADNVLTSWFFSHPVCFSVVDFVKLLRTFCEECLIKGQCWQVDFITVVIFIFLSCRTFYCWVTLHVGITLQACNTVLAQESVVFGATDL